METRRRSSSRFWTKVRKTKKCWVWLGARSGQGRYGAFRVNLSLVTAHRYAYELLVGPIPEGLTLDHLCRNTLGVNPSHLEAVSLRENILRGNGMGARRARQTYCINGHPFSGANLLISSGARYCRICKRARQARSRRARKP